MRAKLITRVGFEALKAEMDHLWRVERPEVTRKVTWAASLGDRSENADYQYNKKRLREIDRRFRYLERRSRELQLVDYAPEQEGRVVFGAWVNVENEEGDTRHFRIVGYDELDLARRYLSLASPMARALLKKQVDDEAVVQTPEGPVIWFIPDMRYETSAAG